MGMPKLHYPKQPWFSSIAVLTSFVNESPLENGVDLQQPNYCLGLKAQQNRKHAWAMHSEKKNKESTNMFKAMFWLCIKHIYILQCRQKPQKPHMLRKQF